VNEPVSRETELAELSLRDDTPIARAAATAAAVRSGRTGDLPRPDRTRVMTVANQKGGVGKTTSAVNMAAALALHGLRVLVLDLDPQGNASTALGVPHQAGTPSIYEVLVDGVALAEVVQPVEGIPGLFCAPATIDLAGAEIELVSLVAAQEVFIPIQCEYYALEGLGQLVRNVELVQAHLNPALHISTILLTMYDGRTRLAAQVAEEVRTHFTDRVLRTLIPRSVRISEAPSYGQTVMTYDPGSSGALSYLEAARELAARGVAQPDDADEEQL